MSELLGRFSALGFIPNERTVPPVRGPERISYQFEYIYYSFISLLYAVHPCQYISLTCQFRKKQHIVLLIVFAQFSLENHRGREPVSLL